MPKGISIKPEEIEVKIKKVGNGFSFTYKNGYSNFSTGLIPFENIYKMILKNYLWQNKITMPKTIKPTMNNQVICGDCLEVMKDIPDKSIDMVLTSPPYNMRTRIRNGKYTTREKSEHFSKKYKHFGDDLPIDEFYSFHKDCINEMLRISKIVIYNFQIVTGSKEAFFKIIGDFNKDIKDIIIWDKGFGQPAMHEKVLSSAYEILLIMEDDKKCGRVIQNSTFKRGEMQNILRIGRGKKMSNIHSAIFPEKLAEEIIKNFSNEGDIILDCFAGSGTTGVACKKLNRNFILIEKEPEYVEIINSRLNQL